MDKKHKHLNHLQRHEHLHRHLDELVVDFVMSQNKLLNETTVMDLIKWSDKQAICPDHEVD